MLNPLFYVLWMVSCLTLVTGQAGAMEPCEPFEGGKVDARILATMRAAAREGRLYRIDPGQSYVGFCVRYFPFQEFRGEFSSIVGGLAYPQNPARNGQALLLIHTTGLRSNTPSLEPMVQGGQFMDTANYPEILFVGQRFEWIDAGQARMYGDLGIRGRTQPVVFDIEVESLPDMPSGRIERIRLRGTSSVSRFAYDMRSHRFFVSETIRLCLSIELVPWRE